jgi:hypothetical protein
MVRFSALLPRRVFTLVPKGTAIGLTSDKPHAHCHSDSGNPQAGQHEPGGRQRLQMLSIPHNGWLCLAPMEVGKGGTVFLTLRVLYSCGGCCLSRTLHHCYPFSLGLSCRTTPCAVLPSTSCVRYLGHERV